MKKKSHMLRSKTFATCLMLTSEARGPRVMFSASLRTPESMIPCASFPLASGKLRFSKKKIKQTFYQFSKTKQCP